MTLSSPLNKSVSEFDSSSSSSFSCFSFLCKSSMSVFCQCEWASNAFVACCIQMTLQFYLFCVLFLILSWLVQNVLALKFLFESSIFWTHLVLPLLCQLLKVRSVFHGLYLHHMALFDPRFFIWGLIVVFFLWSFVPFFHFSFCLVSFSSLSQLLHLPDLN